MIDFGESEISLGLAYVACEIKISSNAAIEPVTLDKLQAVKKFIKHRLLEDHRPAIFVCELLISVAFS